AEDLPAALGVVHRGRRFEEPGQLLFHRQHAGVGHRGADGRLHDYGAGPPGRSDRGPPPAMKMIVTLPSEISPRSTPLVRRNPALRPLYLEAALAQVPRLLG